MVDRNEPVRIGDSLREVLRSMRDDDGRSPVSATAVAGVFGRWHEAVGEAVAAHVQPVTLDGTTLVVKVDDPTWATQLRFLERTLRDRLAEVAGVEVEHLEIRVAGRSGDRRRSG
jgi:predicted nucleic acid-binding Zn ribbon protein